MAYIDWQGKGYYILDRKNFLEGMWYFVSNRYKEVIIYCQENKIDTSDLRHYPNIPEGLRQWP